jgi:lipopolysaccharide export LptBFGC system permease protein LptF
VLNGLLICAVTYLFLEWLGPYISDEYDTLERRATLAAVSMFDLCILASSILFGSILYGEYRSMD